jgi:hypothetical protein
MRMGDEIRMDDSECIPVFRTWRDYLNREILKVVFSRVNANVPAVARRLFEVCPDRQADRQALRQVRTAWTHQCCNTM